MGCLRLRPRGNRQYDGGRGRPRLRHAQHADRGPRRAVGRDVRRARGGDGALRRRDLQTAAHGRSRRRRASSSTTGIATAISAASAMIVALGAVGATFVALAAVMVPFAVAIPFEPLARAGRCTRLHGRARPSRRSLRRDRRLSRVPRRTRAERARRGRSLCRRGEARRRRRALRHDERRRPSIALAKRRPPHRRRRARASSWIKPKS